MYAKKPSPPSAAAAAAAADARALRVLLGVKIATAAAFTASLCLCLVLTGQAFQSWTDADATAQAMVLCAFLLLVAGAVGVCVLLGMFVAALAANWEAGRSRRGAGAVYTSELEDAGYAPARASRLYVGLLFCGLVLFATVALYLALLIYSITAGLAFTSGQQTVAAFIGILAAAMVALVVVVCSDGVCHCCPAADEPDACCATAACGGCLHRCCTGWALCRRGRSIEVYS